MEKNRVAILTFIKAINYGALLQEYALYSKLKEIVGDSVKVVDYSNQRIVDSYRILRKVDRFNIAGLKKILAGLYSLWYLPTKKRKFALFEGRNVILSSVQKRNRMSEFDDYDIAIVGSDQVWNLDITGGDSTYLLDFVPEKKKKCSYAASFGEYRPSSSEWGIITSALNSFHAISVREESAKVMLEEHGVSGARVVLDPTLLLRKSEWATVASEPKESKYILIYCVRKSKRIIDVARQLKLRTGMQIIDLSDGISIDLGIKKKPYIGPDEFVGYFLHADYILTTSFHGCAFSIIAEKPFLVDSVSKDNEKNERATNLLSQLDLLDRQIKDIDGAVDTMMLPIDWSGVSDKHALLAEESTSYLRRLLK